MTTAIAIGGKLSEYGSEQYVPVNALRVDPSYQRTTNITRVKKMAQAFEPSLVGRLVVSLRDEGEYYVVDGQHRLAAMRHCRIALAPCVVYHGWDAEREAEVFRILNTTIKQPTHYERHRAGVCAKHSDALDIERIVADAGCQLTERHPRGGSRGHVAAINTCYQIYHSKNGGAELLRRTFHILSDSFGDEAHAFDSDLITGMAYFLWRAGREPHFDERHLREVLKLTTPTDLLREATTWLQVAKVKYGSISYVLRDRYNKGKRSKKIGTWTEIEWTRSIYKTH